MNRMTHPIVIGLWLAGLFIFSPTKGQAQDINLTVMSYNMRFDFPEKDPNNNWPQRRPLIAELIQRYRPDVIGSQELGPHQAEQLGELLEDYRYFGVGRHEDLSGEAMIIWYRPSVMHPLATGSFWLSETPEVPGTRSWGEGWIRTLTWARFYHIETKRCFYFFNTHLDTKGEEICVKESQLVIDRVRTIAGDTPCFLVADFNSEGGKSPTWQLYQQAGFKDAWQRSQSQPTGSFATWCNYRHPRQERTRRIDWILYQGDIQVHSFATINDHTNGRYPSDHFPVIANLTIEE